MKKQKLSTRQRKLYSLILHADKPISKRYICNAMKDYVLEENKNNLHRRVNNCPSIYRDVIAINNSKEVKKLVIVDRDKFYIGNRSDETRYYTSLLHRANLLLKRARRIKAKCNL